MEAQTDGTLALQLREAREAAELTQKELADWMGVPERTVRSWEAGSIPRPASRRVVRSFIRMVHAYDDGTELEEAMARR